MIIGDAVGLAYAQSGEGIRPAVESGLLAAQVAIEARGKYRREHLQRYEHAMQRRFGDRPGQRDDASVLPAGLRASIARSLMRNHWFAKHVLLSRWFLHANQPALTIP
jgi:flavin-dependent dehydrogenase